METMTDLFWAHWWGKNGNNDRLFLGSQITVNGNCSLQIKKTLAPWKKSYDKPRQVLKSRDICLPEKVHIVKAMVFPVVMSGCES